MLCFLQIADESTNYNAEAEVKFRRLWAILGIGVVLSYA